MLNRIATLKLVLADKLAPSISTRVAIQALRNELVSSSATTVVLDFKGVKSVSRSAAHEIATMIVDLRILFQKDVTLRNQDATVKAMFAAIADQMIEVKPKKRFVNPRTVDFEELCQMVS